VLLKDIWEKLTQPPKKVSKYHHSVPERNFYNSILMADVFEKQKFFKDKVTATLNNK